MKKEQKNTKDKDPQNAGAAVSGIPQRRLTAGGGGKEKETAIAIEDTVEEVTMAALNRELNDLGESPLTTVSRMTLVTPLAWVDDQVITVWFNLVMQTSGRVWMLPPMLTDKLNRGQTPAKIFSARNLAHETLLIPSIQRKHWTVAVHRPGADDLEWYNSYKQYAVTTAPLQKWVSERVGIDVSRVSNQGTPQQRNGHDCGVITCLVALAVGLDREMRGNWGDHTAEARLWMDQCITAGDIPDHPIFNPTEIPIAALVRQTTALSPNAQTFKPTPAPKLAAIIGVSTGATLIGPAVEITQHDHVNAEVRREADDVGDCEDDDDEELDTFIRDANNPIAPSGPTPPFNRSTEARPPPPPTYAQATSTVRVKRQVDPEHPCVTCNKQVHGDTGCQRCYKRAHVGCLTFAHCPACWKTKADVDAQRRTTNVQQVKHTKVVSGEDGNKKRNDRAAVPTTNTTSPIPLPQVTQPVAADAAATVHRNSAIERRSKKPPNNVFNTHLHVNAGSTLDFSPGRQDPSPAVIKGAAFLASLQLITGPPDATDLSWKGLSAPTRSSHMRMLGLVRVSLVQMPDLASLPIPMVCQRVMARTSEALRWKPSTALKNAATLQGAMSRLDQYTTNHMRPIKLSEFSLWADFLRYLTKQDRMHAARIPRAATTEEIRILVARFIKDGRHAMAVLAIFCWTHAARPGDVWKLLREDVTVTAERVTITWRRGKVVSSRGPYSTFAVPGEYVDFLLSFLHSLAPKDPIFTGPWRTNNLLRALRTVSPTLELRSLRRGALQTLAACGISEDLLMIFSGHASVTTLRRYLGWRPAEEIATRCQEAAQALLPIRNLQMG